MKIMFSLLVLLFSNLASADEQLQIDSSFVINRAATVSVKIGRTVFIKNIIVQSEGIETNSAIEVMVNGQIKGTIFAPGSDPSYVVTVAEETSSIEFRHRSGGRMRVLNILATIIPEEAQTSPFDLNRERGIVGLAKAVINISNELAPYTSLTDVTQYLVPMKQKAGMVFVMSEAHGELSLKTRVALEEMALSVDSAGAYIDQLLEKEALFDLAVKILIVRETIRDLLD